MMSVFFSEQKHREVVNISNEQRQGEIEIMKELRHLIQTMKLTNKAESEVKIYYCGAIIKMKIKLETDQLGGWA